ncbi:phosphopantetheine-binding protein [Streptomyces sp. NPDC006334]|uniref:phosphopantetheine-binding protein n=1 Tax=Streptomyces sp. NPDC006334 TaxID=3156754 RepID=UPI0033B9F822
MGTTTTLADTGVPREPASAERHFLGTFGADMADKPVETLPPAREVTVLLDGYGDPAVLEEEFTPVLADVVRMERIPADAHFFEELGADSLVMAHFCARIRKRGDLPAVSMKDVYRHPTLRSLATATAARAEAATAAAPVAQPASRAAPAPAGPVAPLPAGAPHHVLCGALQLFAFLAYAYLIARIAERGYEWISAGSSAAEVYLRSVLFGAAVFVTLCALPVVAKWALVGRWKPQEIRVWSLAYVRFWIVKALIRSDPLVLFHGSPLYLVYLRALGANVGRRSVVLSPRFWRQERYWKVPSGTYLRIFNGTPYKNLVWRLLGVRLGRRVFDDGCYLTERSLVTLGDACTLNAGTVVQCHSQEDGTFKSDRSALGSRCTLGVGAFVHYGVMVGDGAVLAPDSFLMKGELVPEDARWGGNPATPLSPSRSGEGR